MIFWETRCKMKEPLIQSGRASGKGFFHMKVSKTEEYRMYFPFLELHGWNKRLAIWPQSIDSVVSEKKEWIL